MDYYKLLHHNDSFVRKGAGSLLRLYKSITSDSTEVRPVLCNSFPKSGTHALLQVLQTLPSKYYGNLIASMTSSIRFTERPVTETNHLLGKIMNGEIVTGHIFYEESTARLLEESSIANYFIYRDPRDVVLSEAFYLSGMNRWHKLHKYFAALDSLEDRLLLAINGLPKQGRYPDYPDIGQRFNLYKGWLNSPSTLCIKFEDLIGLSYEKTKTILEWYFGSKHAIHEQEISSALYNMNPHQSHTYRATRAGTWRDHFSPRVIEAMKNVAAEIIIELDYEKNNNW